MNISFRMAKFPSCHHVIYEYEEFEFQFFKFQPWTYKGDLREQSDKKGFSLWQYWSLESLCEKNDKFKTLKFQLPQNNFITQNSHCR